MAVRLSALRARRPPFTPRKIPGTHFSVTGSVDHTTILRLEGLGQLKNPMASSGIESATFRALILCLNQFRHCVLPYLMHTNIKTGINNISGRIHLHAYLSTGSSRQRKPPSRCPTPARSHVLYNKSQCKAISVSSLDNAAGEHIYDSS
jgi:hypothetical protein